LQRADVFVSASLHESYGLTIAEAEAHGCWVISHGHYGARGTIVDCSDPQALAAEITAAANQPRPARHIPSHTSNAARQVAEILAAMAC
jgi:glycosyltransferase involved in cell wall biosynthesis